MPRQSKAKKNMLLKSLKMHEAVKSRRRASKTEVNNYQTTSIQKKIVDSIQTEALPQAQQSASGQTEGKEFKDTMQIEQSSELIKSTGSLDSTQTEGKNIDESIQIETPSMLQKSLNSIINGRRIVDISYFYSKLQDIAKHGYMDCGLGCVVIVGERQVGLHSTFKLKCQMCHEIFYLENEAPEEINVNLCAVVGTLSIGCGHSQLQEFSAALNLPLMTPKIYGKCHSVLSTHWEKVSIESMNTAAQKERELAIADGRVDKNGVAIIDVIVDGCWSKRSYKKNYSALSGAAAIIGKRTGEVLFLGVKNKYCSICAQVQNKCHIPKKHICYKNYNGPSTAMESEILVEGFKCSIEMHNLIYGRMVSDGDSNTYAKLLKSRPYRHITVEKIECRNHVLRNLCNKLTVLQTDTKFILKFRKLITQKKILILRRTVQKIIKAHKAESESEKRCNIEPLYDDLLLAHLHAFDDHSRCKPFFCEFVETESQSNENGFYTSTLWSRICLIMSNLASHAPSLIHDIDSNTVERYNSIVAKLVGGKRINFSKRGSYQTRCHAAVVSFNTHKVLTPLYESILGRNPEGTAKKLEIRRLKRMKFIRKYLRKKNRRLFSKGEDKNYGDKCEKPDMLPEIFEKEKNTFYQNLDKTKEEKQKIERDTVLQSSCSEWLELRRNILTASNFGKVIKRRNYISCQNLVKDILYKGSLAHIQSIKHGKNNELKALRQLEMQEGVKINPCGLFIDEEYNYFGATPDGVIDDDTIVEIKCPITTYNKDIRDVVKSKKFPFYKLNQQNELVVNKNHVWYYQVQGQLHITKKQKCLFAIWCGESNIIKTEVIIKDDDLWEHEMEPKLSKFYKECLVPELVDPRFPRNQKIRDPMYLQIAIKEKEEKRLLQQRKNTENKASIRNEQENESRNTEQKNTDQEKIKDLIYLPVAINEKGDKRKFRKRRHTYNEASMNNRQENETLNTGNRNKENDTGQENQIKFSIERNKKQMMINEENILVDQYENLLIDPSLVVLRERNCNKDYVKEINFSEF